MNYREYFLTGGSAKLLVEKIDRYFSEHGDERHGVYCESRDDLEDVLDALQSYSSFYIGFERSDYTPTDTPDWNVVYSSGNEIHIRKVDKRDGFISLALLFEICLMENKKEFEDLPDISELPDVADLWKIS